MRAKSYHGRAGHDKISRSGLLRMRIDRMGRDSLSRRNLAEGEWLGILRGRKSRLKPVGVYREYMQTSLRDSLEASTYDGIPACANPTAHLRTPWGSLSQTSTKRKKESTN